MRAWDSVILEQLEPSESRSSAMQAALRRSRSGSRSLEAVRRLVELPPGQLERGFARPWLDLELENRCLSVYGGANLREGLPLGAAGRRVGHLRSGDQQPGSPGGAHRTRERRQR